MGSSEQEGQVSPSVYVEAVPDMDCSLRLGDPASSLYAVLHPDYEAELIARIVEAVCGRLRNG
jgi:hypothetical protein